MICNKCGADEKEKIEERGPHKAAICSVCGGFIKFIRKTDKMFLGNDPASSKRADRMMGSP